MVNRYQPPMPRLPVPTLRKPASIANGPLASLKQHTLVKCALDTAQMLGKRTLNTTKK